MHARHPEMAARWEKHTPKGKRLPEKVSNAFLAGGADALASLGLKVAAEELRLKIPERKFHGLDAARKSEAERGHKKADEATANDLEKMLETIDMPPSTATQLSTRDPLDRSTAWGAPSNLSAGDTASRLGDMGQPTAVGAVF